MNRTRGQAVWGVLLTLAVLTAGCSTIVGPEPARETLTPAPVPTPAPSFPAGVSEAGVDPDRLADAHAGQLNGTSYTVYASERVLADGEIRREATIRRQVAADGTRRELVTRRAAGEPVEMAIPRYVYFANGSVRVVRAETENSTIYWTGSDIQIGIRENPSEGATIEGYLDLFRDSLEAGEPTDSGLVITGTEMDLWWAASLPSARDLRDEQLSVRVSPEGVVTDVEFTYNGTAESGETLRVIREIRVSRIGNTTVEPPRWVGASGRTGAGGPANGSSGA